MNTFTIDPANDFIWNYDDLLEFLIKFQGQDIYLDTRMEGCCLHSVGLYDLLDKFEFRSVVIKTYNMLEQHPRYVIHQRNPLNVFFNLPANIDYAVYHQWTGACVFGAMYNKPLWHRIGLAANLARNYGPQTLLNFRADPHDEDQRDLFEIQKLFALHPESVNMFMEIRHKFPMQVEPLDGYTLWALTKEHTDQLCAYYPEFLIDLVSESYSIGQSFYPTEKIVRPMLLKKPFIVMGSRNFLHNIKKIGFKTFDQYWNENYDGHDQKERYVRILGLIDSLAAKSHAELEEMYADMKSILDYNHDLILNKKFKLRLNE